MIEMLLLSASLMFVYIHISLDDEKALAVLAEKSNSLNVTIVSLNS